MRGTRIVIAALMTAALVGAGATSAGGARSVDPPAIDLNLVSFKLGKFDGKTVAFSATAGAPKTPIKDSASFNIFTREQSLSYGLGKGEFLTGDDLLEGGEVSADFGKLGEVEGTYEVTGGPIGDKDDKCEAFVRLRATFTGTIKLKAEEGVVDVKERKVKGYLLHAPDIDCGSPHEPEKAGRFGGRDPDVLSACTDGVQYSATHERRGGRHTAFTTGKIGDVRVGRFTTAQVTKKNFVSDEDHTAATVEPGGAFSGTGTYADGELTGDLTVELLGLPEPVALTPANASLRKGNHPDKCSQIG